MGEKWTEYPRQLPVDVRRPGTVGHRQTATGVSGRRRLDHWLGPGCRMRHRRSCPALRQPRGPGDGHRLVEEAIIRAKKKAEGGNLPVTFLAMDALDLQKWSERFDTVIDSGLFHVFSDQDRQRYVEGLAIVLKPGGRLFLLCFSDEEPGTQGPRRISKQELHDAFARGWEIESIQPSRFEVIPDLKDMQFSEGGPKAWFVVIRRAGSGTGSGGP